MKIVKVVWIDSQVGNGWLNKNDLADWLSSGVIECQSVGYLVADDNDMVAIAMTKFGDDHAEIMKIPRIAIVEFTVLGEE